MNRRRNLNTFYRLIDELIEKIGEPRKLADCHGRMGWPKGGVYFFFEDGEFRDDRKTSRVVRVGTHALKEGGKATLWKRLRQHKGNNSGTGNHRQSVFRKHIGDAIINQDNLSNEYEEWLKRSSTPRDLRKKEKTMEIRVSNYIGRMPFVWLKVDDDPGPRNRRGIIEKNSIALLSNFDKTPKIDQASMAWLGHYRSRTEISESGLWNVNHVSDEYNPDYLDTMEELVRSHPSD
jgi:hypothetical protein